MLALAEMRVGGVFLYKEVPSDNGVVDACRPMYMFTGGPPFANTVTYMADYRPRLSFSGFARMFCIPLIDSIFGFDAGNKSFIFFPPPK